MSEMLATKVWAPHDLAQGKEGTTNIIHAEGMRVDSPSSAPKARNPSLSGTMSRAAG
jgi:hypothetical protein